MFVNKYFKLIALFFSLKELSPAANAINCVLTGDTCTFFNVATTEDDPFINPTADKPTSVKKVEFVNSSIYSLTNEFCVKFTRMEDLVMENVGLQRITDYALTKCNKTNTLRLGSNLLVHFPIKKLSRLDVIRTIDMRKNKLVDLDITEIRKRFFYLKSFLIDDNKFDCDKLWPILDEFETNNIKYVEGMTQSTNKKNVKGITCYSEEDRIKSMLDSNLAPIIEEINDIKKVQQQQQTIQEELLEKHENLSAEVQELNAKVSLEFDNIKASLNQTADEIRTLIEKNNELETEVHDIKELNKNISSIVQTLEASLNQSMEQVQTKFFDINKTFATGVKEFEKQIIDVINSKEDYSKQIYYASIAVLSIIAFISVIVIATLISLLWGTTKKSINNHKNFI